MRYVFRLSNDVNMFVLVLLMCMIVMFKQIYRKKIEKLKMQKTILALFALLSVAAAQDKWENAVGITCNPTQVAAGQPVNVNVWWTLDHKRPVDIHLNVLNKESKLYYSGKIVQVEEQRGEATLTIDQLAWEAQDPFMWKVYLTPRDEPFPNFVEGIGFEKHAETGFEAPLGYEVLGQCENIGVKEVTPNVRGGGISGATYVEIIEKPATFYDGGDIELKIDVFAKDFKGDITATLMKQGENEVIASATKTNVPQGRSTQSIKIKTPAGKENYVVNYRNDVTNVEYPVYIVVYFTKTGGDWDDKISSDRTYTVVLQ